MGESYLEVRASIGRIDDERDRGLTTPEDICRYDDIRYGEDPQWNTLDIYCPMGTEHPLPTIISIHGGGWIYGDKERYSHYCMRLAQRGFTVVNFSYRLAPEHRYPAQLQDTCRVVEWVRDNADKYPIDLNNLFILGDSAGGQLCYQFLTMLTNPRFAARFPFAPPKDVAFRACALNCGCYFVPVSRLIPPARMGAMIGSFLPEDHVSVIRQFQIARNITRDFPPAFIMTAENDFLKWMAAPLYRRLRRKKIPCQLKIYGTKEQKDIGHCFHLNCRLELAARCNDDECNFFRNYIK